MASGWDHDRGGWWCVFLGGAAVAGLTLIARRAATVAVRMQRDYGPRPRGGMAEWSKARAWKVRRPQKGLVGSNPTPSAIA